MYLELSVRTRRRNELIDVTREVQAALQRLLANLTAHPPPLTLVSQYLPAHYAAVREGKITPQPVDLIHDKIMAVTESYAAACRTGL